MRVLDSNKYGDGVTLVKVVVIGVLLPLIYLLVAGQLASNHPDMFGRLKELGYWDWFLVNMLFSLFRSTQVQKWYFKEESR